MSKKHVEYLERTNESDYQSAKISYETYIRFVDIVSRCHECDQCGNGKFGDILSECRLHFVRVFASMKRDMEKAAAEKRMSEAMAAEAAAAEAAIASNLAAMVEEDTGMLADVEIVVESEDAGVVTPLAAPGSDKQPA
ncbi:MAG TPA: hypothetical protein VGK67_12025 [Myxococcales bacterium]|jgi:hypothetical protein